ncbi:MAG: SPFH domain-containing protein, partial [Oscillospiraceae bacterium]|nr:SPFH domain-containing protein [Oscillospiraceae bacterium]
EFFYCDSIPVNIMVVKGQKRVTGRSSNTRGTDNIISNGSGIAVADGQCMIIVEQGKILDFCSEPGQYTFTTGGEPSIFAGGGFGANLLGSLVSVFERLKFGGQPGKDTRVYYFNIKELIGNKYGTPTPVPFRVIDQNIGLDIDIAIRCFGEYSYRIVNPMLFYTNVCGNVADSYARETIEGQLKTELMTTLQPAFARISAMGIRYSMLPGHTMELADALNEVLSEKWRDLRGLEIVSFGVSSVSASPEDEQMIKDLQRNAVMRDPTMAAATLVGAQADAMRAAASNEGAGPAMAFMGMNMAGNAGGMNAQNLFQMGQQQPPQPPQPQYQPQQPPPAPAPQPQNAGEWVCSCGAVNTGKFCSQCASPKPADDSWTCSCGAVNTGKFCTECAKPRPAAQNNKCAKCGWESPDPANPPKFCPECGSAF